MEGGVNRPGQVRRITAAGCPITPEDVWNAAIRAGVDPARMALSLCHVLGEMSLTEEECDEGNTVPVEYTLTDGRELVYDASFDNPFRHLGQA